MLSIGVQQRGGVVDVWVHRWTPHVHYPESIFTAKLEHDVCSGREALRHAVAVVTEWLDSLPSSLDAPSD